MKEAGYGDLSVAKLIALRRQGVDGEFAAEFKKLGYANLSTSKLIALRSQGVDPGSSASWPSWATATSRCRSSWRSETRASTSTSCAS